MPKYLFLCILFCLSIAFPPRGATEGCVTLSEAIRLSESIAPGVGQANARLAGAEARLSGIKSDWRPQISGFAQTNNGPQGLGDGRTNNQIGIAVSQRLWDFGRGRAEQDGAKARISSADFALSAAKNEVAAKTAQTYLHTLMAQERADAARLRKSYLGDVVKSLPTRLAAKDITAAEKSRVEAEYSLAEADLIHEELALASAKSSLAVLTGGNGSICAGLKHVDDYFAQELPPTLREIIDTAFANYPDLLAAEAERVALRSDLHSAARSRAPSISLQGVIATANEDFSGQFETDSRIGIRVDAPIFGSGKYSAQKQEAAADLRAVELGIAQLRRDLEEKITLTWQSANSFRAIALSQSSARDSLRAEAAALTREFENGLRSYQDILHAEASLQQAVLQEIEARFLARQQTLQLVSFINALTDD